MSKHTEFEETIEAVLEENPTPQVPIVVTRHDNQLSIEIRQAVFQFGPAPAELTTDYDAFPATLVNAVAVNREVYQILDATSERPARPEELCSQSTIIMKPPDGEDTTIREKTAQILRQALPNFAILYPNARMQTEQPARTEDAHPIHLID
jgi:hypothetical protein